MNIGWKFVKEARIEPPIQAENFRSGGSKTLIFMVEGANAITSLCILSFKTEINRHLHLSMLVPPAKTIFPYKSFRISVSHLRIDWKQSS